MTDKKKSAPQFSDETIKSISEALEEKNQGIPDDEDIHPREFPIQSMAESLFFIERHLKAMVYFERIRMSDGHMTFRDDIFIKIYGGDSDEKDVDFSELESDKSDKDS
jgi:hypothetical protein